MGQQQRRTAAVDLVIDVDPVPIDLWHRDFLAASRRIWLRPYSSAIHATRGNAHAGKLTSWPPPAWAAGSSDNFMTKSLPQRTTWISQIYSLRPIPIWIASTLERDHSCGQGRHRPGGCQTISQREAPP